MEQIIDINLLQPAITVGSGPLILAVISFVFSIITGSAAELLTFENILGKSLYELAQAADFISLSALSTAIIVFSVAFMGTPGLDKIIIYLLLLFVVLFLFSTLLIYWSQQIGSKTTLGIILHQLSKALNFIAFAAAIFAISIPTFNFIDKHVNFNLKSK